MKNKIFKTILILIILLFSITAVITVVASVNIYHLQNCNIENCNTCKLIHMSINFSNNLGDIYILILKIGIVFIFTEIIKILILKLDNKTLVECKVQQNK